MNHSDNTVGLRPVLRHSIRKEFILSKMVGSIVKIEKLPRDGGPNPEKVDNPPKRYVPLPEYGIALWEY